MSISLRNQTEKYRKIIEQLKVTSVTQQDNDDADDNDDKNNDN